VTDIAGKNILITGGASGLGRLAALEMARLGGRLVIWDVNADGLARVVEELTSLDGPPAHGYLCDVSDRQAVYATAARVTAEVGPIQILVNNAGVVSGKRFLDCSDEQIRRTIEVNAMALFWTAKAFLPDMIAARTGHLVTVASAAGVIGVAGLADYSASKWAAVGFDEAIRMELRRAAPGVRTTVVCPYFVDTGMFRGVRTRFSWLLPILREDRLAAKIVRAVRRNRRRLLTPWLVWTVAPLRVLPVGLFDAIAELLGVNRAMDHFVGRAAAPVEKPPADN